MDFEPIFLVVSFVAFFLALTVHEFCHALTAYSLGDKTAQYQGRLTLNPIAHIDLFGTILLPLILILSGSGIVFGWAKPVPVNYFALRNQRWGPALVSVAGPAANLLFGVFSLICLILVLKFTDLAAENLLVVFLQFLAMINFVLMVFNLIPIPPLDGSKILYAILPESMNNFKLILEQYGLILLIILLFAGVGFIFTISGAIFQFFWLIVNMFL